MGLIYVEASVSASGVKISTITSQHVVSVRTIPKDPTKSDTENLIESINKIMKADA